MAASQSPAPRPYCLILASGSPRRRELLAEAGYRFEVHPPAEDVECGVCSESGPAGLVAELAYRKAAAVWKQIMQDKETGRQGDKETNLADGSPCLPRLILAADTVAECDGFILGKPRDEADARAMLTQLSGREHRVLTGVCLWRLGDRKPVIKVAVTRLEMDPLTTEQLDEYLASGQWEGKAGGFGYQDRLGWVHVVDGSESNVVGLPMELLAEMLAELGAGSEVRGARNRSGN